MDGQTDGFAHRVLRTVTMKEGNTVSSGSLILSSVETGFHLTPMQSTRAVIAQRGNQS